MEDDDRLQTRSYELERSVLLFPEPENVFADPIDRHFEHLHPLASIDLATVSPELSGWVHLVLPVDPYGEQLGSHTEAFHNEYVSENWIAFKMVEGRYRFLADFRYFFVENDELPEPYPNYRSDLAAHYVKQRASYEEHKQRYRHGGWDEVRGGTQTNHGANEPLYQFKERAWNHNWAVYPPPPSAYRVVKTGEWERWAGVPIPLGRSCCLWHRSRALGTAITEQTRSCCFSIRWSRSLSRPLSGPSGGPAAVAVAVVLLSVGRWPRRLCCKPDRYG